MTKCGPLEWKKPAHEILVHPEILAIYEVRGEEENKEEMNILTFRPETNTFHGKGGSPILKYRDIKAWLPIPERTAHAKK